VKRCELDERLELGKKRVVDQRRLEVLAAVDDAVSDRRDPGRLFERLDCGRALRVVDDAELEAGGAGVDDEHVAQCRHVQSRISGSSSPWARV
jgi:hypothetical protein